MIADLDRTDFVARFGGIYEHSPWIAERVWDGEMGAVHDSAAGLAARMAQVNGVKLECRVAAFAAAIESNHAVPLSSLEVQ